MENEVLDLSKGRVISFREYGLTYSHQFDRITARDWDKYFDSIVATSENRGNERRTLIDPQTGASDLVRAKVVAVDGYAEGFTAKTGWKEALPPRHVRLVAALLMAVSVDDTEIRTIDPFHQEVALRCAWTSEEPGTMKYFTGLIHRFRPVTAEHERKFNRVMSESRVVGGSRSGKTIYPSRQKVFLALYDELIEDVEGYLMPGQPDAPEKCSTRRADIVREMDALHKVVAVGQLFNSVVTDEDEEEQ